MMKVWYTLKDPDGDLFDKESADVPDEMSIGQFGVKIARDNGHPNSKALVYPSDEEGLRACPNPNKLSSYNGESGTESKPFFIHLKAREPANALHQPPTIVPPAAKQARTEIQRRDISMGDLEFTQIASYFRADLESDLPAVFDIGAFPSFKSPLLQPELFLDFVKEFAADRSASERRGIITIVAMPGWGKTFAMDLLAKLVVAVRCEASSDDCQNPDIEAIRSWMNKLNRTKREEIENLLRCVVPVAITLNSTMDLAVHAGRPANYEEEIAQRFVYSFFAKKETTFRQWKANLRKNDVAWSCAAVLRDLKKRATDILHQEAVLLLLIDEPDKGSGALDVVSALKESALNRKFNVECRVVMSALEQCWLFAESAASGRPIPALRLQPPNDVDLKKALASELGDKLDSSVHSEDTEDVTGYITALAGGHWRTISSVNDYLGGSRQLTSDALKMSAGRAPAHLPTAWGTRIKPEKVMGQLEEALAHAIIGSKLHFMEPLYNGTVWQAITTGVILDYLGVSTDKPVRPIVPILLVLRLAQADEEEKQRDSKLATLIGLWNSQRGSAQRDARLVNVLGTSRFFPTPSVASTTPTHELYESLSAQFMLLRWDAHARIDKAVEERWAEPAEHLMSVPDDVAKQELVQYDQETAKKFRDKTNSVYVSASGTPSSRPSMWLVPPAGIVDEAELRLCIFRGAECCTKPDQGVAVHPPNPGDAGYFACKNKLSTTGAALSTDGADVLPSTGTLRPGSIIEPARGNSGFDSLTVLRKPSGGWVFALIDENKLEKGKVDVKKATQKLNLLKSYRGILWRGPNCGEEKPSSLDGLRLPNVEESDVVWVLLADVGFTGHLKKQVSKLLSEDQDSFRGHVLLMTLENFFGPCFGRIGILDQNRKRKVGHRRYRGGEK